MQTEVSGDLEGGAAGLPQDFDGVSPSKCALPSNAWNRPRTSATSAARAAKPIRQHP
ncbi:hypothetical protein [Streptomyces griseoruber]|uniref:hypothetical protein n=1 Tax=Streptomyces griseoruber TaxID=1943 RepID=UPI000A45F31D